MAWRNFNSVNISENRRERRDKWWGHSLHQSEITLSPIRYSSSVFGIIGDQQNWFPDTRPKRINPWYTGIGWSLAMSRRKSLRSLTNLMVCSVITAVTLSESLSKSICKPKPFQECLLAWETRCVAYYNKARTSSSGKFNPPPTAVTLSESLQKWRKCPNWGNFSFLDIKNR